MNPTVITDRKQQRLAGSDIESGEVTIDLDLPDDIDGYDVDDLGDGTIVVQYWTA